VDSKTAIKLIKAEGWYWVRTTGSHFHYKHDERPGTTTVPHPKKDLTPGTIKGIEHQSGVKLTGRKR
jgi:predicted RNA binding protein YcfA (HicA-like mRNA interferase family)